MKLSTHYYSCLSTATIEYSCRLCVCLYACVHVNSKNYGSVALKLEHIVVYENSSDDFDIGHCPIKVKSRRDFEFFLHLPQYKLSRPISQLWHISVGANVFPWDFHEESKPTIFLCSLGISYDKKC